MDDLSDDRQTAETGRGEPRRRGFPGNIRPSDYAILFCAFLVP